MGGRGRIPYWIDEISFLTGDTQNVTVHGFRGPRLTERLNDEP